MKELNKKYLLWFHDKGVKIAPIDIERIATTKIPDMTESDRETLDGIRRVIIDDLEECVLRELYE